MKISVLVFVAILKGGFFSKAFLGNEDVFGDS